ncbi:HYC_CC_PP family protein [Aequorivita nionensis]|uniref:HYC_CC_PP family protein n=1 Tax=Flavobacteriaceae TaxID=49546 RepID=UPI003965BE9C
MKSFFTRILSFFLAVFILFSTSSFTVDMHFCCNKLVDMSILGKAKACKDMAQKKDSYTKQCTTLQEKSCCSNQTVFKKGEDTFKKSNTIVETETLVFVNTFFYTYINLFEGLEENITSFKTYRPPLLSTDLIILNETFLI